MYNTLDCVFVGVGCWELCLVKTILVAPSSPNLTHLVGIYCFSSKTLSKCQFSACVIIPTLAMKIAFPPNNGCGRVQWLAHPFILIPTGAFFYLICYLVITHINIPQRGPNIFLILILYPTLEQHVSHEYCCFLILNNS